MKMMEKKDFIKRCSNTLEEIYDLLDNLPGLALDDIKAENTALVIVDMINGFAREGALKSSRVEELIPDIAKLSEVCDKWGIKKIAFADSHTEASPEFGAYPPHCMSGTSEAEIVEEIKAVGGYELIPKNSTNGFLEETFQGWLEQNNQINTFIITGDCTDICVQQFAITLKTWFNRKNAEARVIVPMNTVDTYDFGIHDAELMNVTALYNMIINGVQVVSRIGI